LFGFKTTASLKVARKTLYALSDDTILVKKKIFFLVGFSHFLGILAKNRFFGLLKAKIGPVSTSSIYILNQRKKLYQKISIFLTRRKSVEILGEN
jgi:hypothetical protein